MTNNKKRQIKKKESDQTEIQDQNTIFNKALELQQKGDIQEAINLYNLSIKNGYKDERVLLNLAGIYHMNKKYNEAIQLYDQLIDQNPNSPKALSNLGLLCKEIGEYEVSENFFRQSLNLNPNSHITLCNLGDLLNKQNKFDEAEILTRKAIEIKPKYVIAINNLAVILKNKKKLDEAEFWIQKSIKFDNNNENSYAIYSDIKRSLEDLSEAVFYLKKSIDQAPDFKKHATLGQILQDKGEFKEAEWQLIRSLEINPNFAISYYYLSLFKNVIKNGPIFEHLFKDEILKDQNLEDQINIYFARANIMHKTKNYIDSAKYLKKANDLHLQMRSSEYKEIEKQTNLLRTLSDKYQIMESYESDEQAVFIVGMARCGSTLVENILRTNNELTCLGENAIFASTFKEWIEDEGISLSKLYFDNLKDVNSNKRITTNKLLYNYMYAGIICSQIPNAKIIFCYRNPLDNLLSLYRANFEEGNNFSSSIEDSAHLYVNHKETMDYYKSKFPRNIYALDYDLLVSEPSSEIKKLIRWLDWKWNNKYLKSHLNLSNISTASKIEVRSPINNNSVGLWKNYKDLLSPAIKILKDAKLYP